MVFFLFFSSSQFLAAVSIRTTCSLHSALFQHNNSIPPLVAALPPGPGSLDFSPACFGIFYTDLLRACISSDVSVLFYLIPCPCPSPLCLVSASALSWAPVCSFVSFHILLYMLSPGSYEIRFISTCFVSLTRLFLIKSVVM